METYTFKIKIDDEVVVVACHMQFEQFYDSVKMSGMEKLLERYPKAYITACDYKVDDNLYIHQDFAISDLASLTQSKDLRDYLIDSRFVGFVGDLSYSVDSSNAIVDIAHNFLVAEKEVINDEGVDDGYSETVEK